MADERLRRLAVEWGGLALCAQLWVALVFVTNARLDVRAFVAQIDYATLADRMSQFRPPRFKFPWLTAYAIVFALTMLGVLTVLLVWGLRQAIAPEDEAAPEDSKEMTRWHTPP